MSFRKPNARRRAVLTPLVLAGALFSCGGDELLDEDHEAVESIRLYDAGGLELNTTNLTIARTQTMRIEVRFFAEDGDRIDLDEDHDIAFAFNPGTLASAAMVAGQHFMRDVTAGPTAGSGTLSIGYGHDGDTSEQTFGPYPLTITP